MTPVSAWALSLSGLGGLLGATELIARRWLRADRGYYVFPPHAKLEFDIDRDTLPQLQPIVRTRFNRDGERGDEAPRGGRLFRVLVIGGSSAQCMLVDQGSTWPSLLQKHLNAPATLEALGVERAHVGNIGKASMHSASLVMIMERVLPRYEQLDALVMMFGSGEVVRWMSTDTPADGVIPLSEDECFVRRPGQQFGLEPRSWALVELLRRLRTRVLVDRRERVGRWIGRARERRAEALEMRTEVTDPAPMLANYERNVTRMLELARAHARHVLVVRQPWFEKPAYTDADRAMFWNFGVGELTDGSGTVYYSDAVCDRVLDQVDEATARVSRAAGVAEMELMSVVTPSPEHYYDRNHYTAAACRLIGVEVARVLIGMASQPSPVRPRPPRITPTASASA